jgi:titin
MPNLRHLKGVARLFSLAPWFLAAWSAPGAVFLVTNTSDTGAGSLRQAILDANDNPGVDQVSFAIPGTGVRTISPAAPLPPLTEAAVIDGTTQSGYVDRPLIEINGVSAGSNAGLRLLSGGCVVRGLCINRFGADGVRIEGPGTNLIQANFIGTDTTGSLDRGNALEGIFVYTSWGNIIGGTNTADRNVICGNGDAGIYLSSGGGNIVLGNHIGASRVGSVAIRNNNNGIAVYNSKGNSIGGDTEGARNIISGNLGSGVVLYGSQSRENVIQGNYIGVSASGSSALSNSANGITISDAPSNTVGGVTVGAGNLISGNGSAGVFLTGASATRNRLEGNRIGCDADGTAAVGNRLAGITLLGAGTNFLGGIREAGNLISGNKQDGIFCATNTVGNFIQGNWIGLDATGTNALKNALNGITLDGARSNRIGGGEATFANVISGNTMNGVALSNRASGNSIVGNFIGTDSTGLKVVSNQLCGIRLDSAGNYVGSPIPGEGNLISGNGQDGVCIAGTNAYDNVLRNNWIGVSVYGTNALPNSRAGVGISSAPLNVVGGAETNAGNVISANLDAGIWVYGLGADYNRIEGNKLGTDPSGTLALGNRLEGIYVELGRSNSIGGSLPGAGNLVSANRTRGIWLNKTVGNRIQGNWVGVKADGVGNLGNKYHGIECSTNANANVIGSDGYGSNRLAHSETVYCGIRIRYGSVSNSILGNEIFLNGALGIDLGTAGVLANDACDTDGGSEQRQNYPVLSQVIAGSSTVVQGVLRSGAGKTYVLRFYASTAVDPAGYGEGQFYLGKQSVTTDASCTANFTAQLPEGITPGTWIAATATAADGNSSEFSRSVAAATPPSLLSTFNETQQVLTLSWPTNVPSGFILMQTPNLTAPVQWSPVTNQVQTVLGKFVVPLPVGTGSVFYALGL